MKYIRTKDGIFLRKKAVLLGTAHLECYCDEDGNITTIKADQKKYREANTIEKLCDISILKNCDIIFLNKEHSQYRFEGSNEWFDITDVELRIGIYGAIWTDKGLIFVAKMNKEGELELI